ncbi:MAG: hypothetical protein IKR69_07490 [Bacteroidales bacterium]|nr:hypothetical protein [Bacteroidales bacterium]
MKKFVFILASILLVAALASCNKSNADKNNGKSGGNSGRVSTKVEMKLIANFNADYFRYADFQVKYPEGGSIKTENLVAPEENTRSNWSKTFYYTSEADVVFEIICTPKDVEYETATKTQGSKEYEYVIFNNNCLVSLQIKNYDASGQPMYEGYYGSTLKNYAVTNEGQVVETHGFGAEMSISSLAVKINGEESNNFKENQLNSYKFHYRIVTDEDGLTAESVKE